MLVVSSHFSQPGPLPWTGNECSEVFPCQLTNWESPQTPAQDFVTSVVLGPAKLKISIFHHREPMDCCLGKRRSVCPVPSVTRFTWKSLKVKEIRSYSHLTFPVSCRCTANLVFNFPLNGIISAPWQELEKECQFEPLGVLTDLLDFPGFFQWTLIAYEPCGEG